MFPQLTHSSLRTCIDSFPNIRLWTVHTGAFDKWQLNPTQEHLVFAGLSISLPPTVPSVPLNLHSPKSPIVSIATQFSGILLSPYVAATDTDCSLKHSLLRVLITLHSPAFSSLPLHYSFSTLKALL